MPAMKLFLFVVLLATTAVFAEEPQAEFDAGNRAFEEQKYLAAREHYEALVAKGVWSPNVFYNLGSANQQIGADGLAVLNYERALAINPTHREAYAALDLLRKNSDAKTAQRSWRQKGADLLTFNHWVIVATVAAWVGVFAILLPVARRRRIGFTGWSLAALSLCAAGACGAAARLRAHELNAAIVVAKQAEARLAPADRAALADTLPAGSRVEWLAERSGWVECRLPNGERAWVPDSTVERVRLAASS